MSSQTHQKRSETYKAGGRLSGYMLYALFCLLIPAAFITLHLFTPSDGARMSDGEDLFTPVGAVVSPYGPGTGSFQEGDVVSVVAGKDMADWAANLFRLGVSRPQWEFGETVTYSVIRDGAVHEIRIQLERLPWRSILGQYWGALLFAFVSQVVAGFVLLRRPQEPAARALFLWAMSGSHTYAWSFFLQISDIVSGFGFWLFRIATPGLWLMYFPAGLHMALVFPKPLGFVKRRPWLIKGLYFLSFGLFLVQLAWYWVRSEDILSWLNAWGPAENIVAAVFLFVTILMVIVQYRTNRTYTERVRMRWAVYGAGISGTLGLILWNIVPAVTGENILNPNLLGLLMLPFPLSLALSIWRHQLFDIDVIIRKTLLYVTLTASLLLIYFSAVVFLQQVFRTITGQDSPVAIVLSTLTIAALFNPMRVRLQEFIDRRFYREKYDAEQALARFASVTRDEVDIDQLTNTLISVVEETIQPQKLGLWLRPIKSRESKARNKGEFQEFSQ